MVHMERKTSREPQRAEVGGVTPTLRFGRKSTVGPRSQVQRCGKSIPSEEEGGRARDTESGGRARGNRSPDRCPSRGFSCDGVSSSA